MSMINLKNNHVLAQYFKLGTGKLRDLVDMITDIAD